MAREEGIVIFQLDLRSRLPIYEQLVEKFKELIIHHVLKPDEQLPSVRVLARDLTINPNTIQKAYGELEAQGYIYSVQGKGSFVSPAMPNPNSQRIAELQGDLVKIASELIYLGLSKSQVQKIIAEMEGSKGGGLTSADH